jgi:hypothetical protein
LNLAAGFRTIRCLKGSIVQAFKDIYFRIILSILVVIAAMLALQGGLNKLKLRAFVVEATASQLQVFASTIEDTVTRSERLGLAISESAGATELLDRLLEQNPDIQQILVVSPNGETVLSAGQPLLEPAYRDDLLRKVFTGRDKVTILDAGPLLYTGRTMLDSANAVMGAVIVTVPTSKFIGEAEQSFASLVNRYKLLFAVIAAGLCPFIIFQFASVGRVYKILDPSDLEGGHQFQSDIDPDLARLQKLMNEGNVAFTAAEARLTRLEAGYTIGTKA